MFGRKILAIFLVVGLLLGVACALNPQPEPPGARFGADSTPGTPGPGGPISVFEDAGATGSNDNAEAGARMTDSSSTSDGSTGSPDAMGQGSDAALQGGDADAEATDLQGEAGDAAAEAGDALGESSSDAGTDAPEEGATTSE
jgi:hypothetical protein